MGKANKKHGMCHTPTYRSWKAMMERCGNEKHVAYAQYGGRGIKVCYRWCWFKYFVADMGKRPKGKTLDRINVNKGYSPSNCRWADATTQANNRRPRTRDIAEEEEIY